jgi:hypothetical protein
MTSDFVVGNTPLTFTMRESDGYLVIAPGVKVEIRKRPNRFHRLMLRLFFGWEWEL